MLALTVKPTDHLVSPEIFDVNTYILIHENSCRHHRSNFIRPKALRLNEVGGGKDGFVGGQESEQDV